jgi:hypothetical protein
MCVSELKGVRQVSGGSQDAQRLAGVVEAHAIFSRQEIPAQLSFTIQQAGLFQQGLASGGISSGLGQGGDRVSRRAAEQRGCAARGGARPGHVYNQNDER